MHWLVRAHVGRSVSEALAGLETGRAVATPAAAIITAFESKVMIRLTRSVRRQEWARGGVGRKLQQGWQRTSERRADVLDRPAVLQGSLWLAKVLQGVSQMGSLKRRRPHTHSGGSRLLFFKPLKALRERARRLAAVTVATADGAGGETTAKHWLSKEG